MRANLNEAEAKLKEARNKVEAASQVVNKTVNDEVLFRTIQREVLDKKEFDKAAISVGVKNRVVTLTGNVPDEDTRKRAVKLAREQAGVKDVNDELQVGEDKTSAPSGQSEQSKQTGQPEQPEQSGQSGQSDQSEQSEKTGDKAKPADDKPQPPKQPAADMPPPPNDPGDDAGKQPEPDSKAEDKTGNDAGNNADNKSAPPKPPMRES